MEKLIIYVDIDETICFYEGKRHYPNAIPNKENINKIKYWTARGSVTQIDWMETTVNQLKKWGCKYHKISVGEKPHYDLLICDKTKRIEEI